MVAENVPPAPTCIGMAPFQLVLPDKELDDGTWLLSGFGADGMFPVDPTDRSQTEAALRWYFPDARVLACDAHDWLADPLFEGPWRLDPPGLTYEGPRIMKEPEGRLCFAGSDFDESLWRISIEGAVHSGHRAATQLAGAMGLPRR
jgi:monoamine oxidase